MRSANVLKIIAQNDKRLIIPQEDTLGKIGPGPGPLRIGQCRVSTECKVLPAWRFHRCPKRTVYELYHRNVA